MRSSLTDWTGYLLATRLNAVEKWSARLSAGRAPDLPVAWADKGPSAASGSRRLIYRGPLQGASTRIHYAFDGWQGPPREMPLTGDRPGSLTVEIPEVAGHYVLDCAFTDGDRWDNNHDANYRLWIDFDPFDAHLHVDGRGRGPLGLTSLQAALRSAGIGGGLASWPANHRALRAVALDPAIKGLVWARPGRTPVTLVDRYLRAGFVGLKLHPTVDNFPADTPLLNPYLDLTARWRVPVAIHSAPGTADPDAIRRLAERFPTVPILFYHTYLGPHEGRYRAIRHAQEQPNLYLETSWCAADQVREFVDGVGPERVLFGSDASLDGPSHFCRRPPNVEGRETYNDGLLWLAGTLDPAATRLVLGANARALFRLSTTPS